MKRNGLETRIAKLREENKILARKVANRLMGIHKYAVMRETSSSKHPSGWKTLRIFGNEEEAYWFAAHNQKGRLLHIKEIFE